MNNLDKTFTKVSHHTQTIMFLRGLIVLTSVTSDSLHCVFKVFGSELNILLEGHKMWLMLLLTFIKYL